MATKYNLKNDIIFKAFFGRKGKEEYLTEFLEALLGIKIQSIEIKEEVSLERLSINEKGGRLDMQAKINSNTIANIEMQRKDYGNIEIRTTFYAAKIISREAVAGTEYENIQKTVLINILDYKLFPQYKEYISKTAIVLDEHREYVVTDNIEWWYIELPKFREQQPDMNKAINQWIAFIDDENKELIEVAEKNNKTIKKAREDMDYLTGDKEVRRLAELREKWDMEFEASIRNARKLGSEYGEKLGRVEGEKIGRVEGEKIGRAEGEKIGRAEGERLGVEKIAKKLLELGVHIEKIMEATGLSKEEIEKLQ